MNLLKNFWGGRDNANMEDETYDDIYAMPEDLKMEMEPEAQGSVASPIDNPARKDLDIHPASPDKVALKLLRPQSHAEATMIADKIKDGCIVLLDISNLTKEKALRLVDFVAGVAYVLGGEMIKTNKNTIVVAPAGVDISGFAQEEVAEVAEATEAEAEEVYEETAEEA